jgi:hypothetical protein
MSGVKEMAAIMKLSMGEDCDSSAWTTGARTSMELTWHPARTWSPPSSALLTLTHAFYPDSACASQMRQAPNTRAYWKALWNTCRGPIDSPFTEVKSVRWSGTTAGLGATKELALM